MENAFHDIFLPNFNPTRSLTKCTRSVSGSFTQRPIQDPNIIPPKDLCINPQLQPVGPLKVAARRTMKGPQLTVDFESSASHLPIEGSRKPNMQNPKPLILKPSQPHKHYITLLYGPSVHFMFHVLFHLIVHCRGVRPLKRKHTTLSVVSMLFSSIPTDHHISYRVPESTQATYKPAKANLNPKPHP